MVSTLVHINPLPLNILIHFFTTTPNLFQIFSARFYLNHMKSFVLFCCFFLNPLRMNLVKHRNVHRQIQGFIKAEVLKV